jgi:hypothetical protein
MRNMWNPPLNDISEALVAQLEIITFQEVIIYKGTLCKRDKKPKNRTCIEVSK